MRNPGGREAGIGCTALQLFEVVVAHRRAHGHSAAQREPFVDVSPLTVERFERSAPRPEHNVI